MKIVGLLAVSVIAAGCGKKQDKAAHDRDCEEMGKAFEALRRMEPPPAHEDGAGKEFREKMIPSVAKLSTLHCIKNNWAPDAIACVKTSHDPKEECFKLLSADQQASMKVDLQLKPDDLGPVHTVPDLQQGSGK
jgi:hypothetical protein